MRRRPTADSAGLRVEPLEPRLLLSSDLAFDPSGSTDLSLDFDSGTTFRLLDSTATVIDQVDLSSLTNNDLIIQGTAAADTLTLTFGTAGLPGDVAIRFKGGDGADKLVMTSPATGSRAASSAP